MECLVISYFDGRYIYLGSFERNFGCDYRFRVVRKDMLGKHERGEQLGTIRKTGIIRVIYNEFKLKRIWEILERGETTHIMTGDME